MSTITEDRSLKSVHRILSRLTGEERFDLALHLATKDLLQLKLMEAERQLEHFENRYGMNFERFTKAWEKGEIPNRHAYEVEQDYWAWETALTDKQRLEELMAEIP